MSETVSKKQACIYCGNNPVSHFGAWFDSTFLLLTGPLFYRIFTLPGGRALTRYASWIIDGMWNVLVYANIVTFSDDVSVIPSDRGKVLYEEAIARGWKMETAVIFGRAMDTYRLTFSNGKVISFSGLPRFDAFLQATASWIDDKALMKQRLGCADISVSEGKSFGSLVEAQKYFKSQSHPVIVKPRVGSRGRHTTTKISELNDFTSAFRSAKQICHFVIVEEHLEGSVYRATMIDGKLAGVLAGDPPRVVGDGVHTISELIAIKNQHRHERVGEVKVTDMTHSFLKRRGYALHDVLLQGVTIDLREKIGLSYGGNAREVTHTTHPKLRSELERAARVVDDPIIGFDFITPDVSVDPGTVRWGIIECNALPFINLHHDPLEGEPVNVAGILLDYVVRNEHLYT